MTDLTDKVMNRIENQKPKNQALFWGFDLLRAITLGAIFFWGGIIIAFLFWDWPKYLGGPGFGIEDFWLSSLISIFLGLVLIFLLSLIGYFIYRQTDWPLVSNRGFLVILLSLALFGSATTFFIIVQNSSDFQNSFRFADERFEGLPIRPPRPARMYKQAKKDGRIKGVIIKIERLNSGKTKLVLANPFETIELEVDSDTLKDFRPGQKVEIMIDPNNSNAAVLLEKR